MQNFLDDLTVIFFTDGNDTVHGPKKAEGAVIELKESLAKLGANSRIFTIGFSKDHNATFLNQLALAGKDLGNFFFIDVHDRDYKTQISRSLEESLSLVDLSHVAV